MEINIDSTAYCDICQDDFTDPRLLPCQHAFCIKCLKGYCRRNDPGEHVRCPVCRKEFRIPDHGVNGLPRNIVVDDPSLEAVSTTAADGSHDDYQTLLTKHFRLISRCLVVTEGLLSDLSAVDYLKWKITVVERQLTPQSKVDTLLATLRQVPQQLTQLVFHQFMFVLRHDGQEHVANIFHTESDARPMSDEHYQLLFSRNKPICLSMDPLNGLIDELVAREVLNEREANRILTKTQPDDDICSEVLNILLHKPDSAFDIFINSLCSTRQEHVASLLGHASRKNVMTEEHRQLLMDKSEDLSQFINPTYTLLNRLVAAGEFTKRDVGIVMSKPSYTEMALQLIHVLLRRPNSAFDVFTDALYDTDQYHVVYILTGRGSERPLSWIRRKVLRQAREYVVRKVEIKYSTLLAKLITNGVLNEVDMLRIEAKETSEDKTGMLIDAIVRKSDSAYDKFIQALKHKDIGQLQIAETLEGLELRGLVDAKFGDNTTNEERNRIVKVVGNNIKAMVGGSGSDVAKLIRLMEQNGFAVSDVSVASIHISFRCFTEESLVNLKRLYTDKTLDKLFTQVFCPQFAKQGLESLTLNITDDEFDKITEAFKQRTAAINTDDPSRKFPVELLELMLMRIFIKLFDDHYKSHCKTLEAYQLAYSTLAAVCYNWWQTMNGWPQSPTKHWFKHKLRRSLKYACRPYVVSPRLNFDLPVSSSVLGMTHCDNELFIVCYPDRIHVIGRNYEKLSIIKLHGLKVAADIASCTETKQLYVADKATDLGCVWRASVDGHKVVKWLPNKSTTTSQFSPKTLSVTSRRLLVTSESELLLYGEDGDEQKRISLSDIKDVQHAVETSRGTFIISHTEPQRRVCEVNVDGHVISVYSDQQQLDRMTYLSLASGGRVFVAGYNNLRVLLLNSRLELERVLLDIHQLPLVHPRRLCYMEEAGQLAVGCNALDLSTGRWLSNCVQWFTVREST